MSSLYQDPHIAIDIRVNDLLSQMTREEKIAQLHGWWLVISDNGDITERTDVSDTFSHRDTRRTFESRIHLGVGQITRPFGTRPIDPATGIRALNQLQQRIIATSRLGIPAMFHEECLTGLMCHGATLFPAPLNLSATWDLALAKKVGRLIREEAMSIGCHQGLAPVLDVSRDVRWGRTEETFGEDPYLVGMMATRYVQGLQGEKRDFLATLKHYAGHSFSEGARNHAPVHLGFRELNDIFLLPFEMAVKLANAGSVMPAYHDIDNQPCHNDAFLLTEVLRRQWGFDGIIVADYGGVSLLHQHHAVTQGPMTSAASAFSAGLDVELPKDDCAAWLGDALDAGLISQARLDACAARVLREKFRLGLFEHPFIPHHTPTFQSEEAVSTAREVAARSVVLLENRHALPLQLTDNTQIAVIGPTADDPLALLSGYSFPVHLILNDTQASAQNVITPYQALVQAIGPAQLAYHKGCEIIATRSAGAPVFPGDVGKTPGVSPVSQDASPIPAAAALARRSTVAICFVGDLAGLFQTGTVGEGSDADSLRLPGVQQQLLEAVVATGTPTIVVQTSGRPYSLQGLEKRLAGYLMAFQPGQEGGRAIADILTGKRTPCGKLTVSVPHTAGAMPYFYNHKMKSAGTPVALHFPPIYPFGYGRSYTTFQYSGFHLAERRLTAHGEITCAITLRNTGQVAGAEVIQVYVRDILASLVRPEKELKAFARVHLAPGQAARVYFTIPVDMLNFTGMQHTRIVEPGDFAIMVGASSAQILFQDTVTLDGETVTLPTQWRMESHARVEYLP